MTGTEANNLRCIAHEIIIILARDGHSQSIRLIQQHSTAALKRLQQKEKQQNEKETYNGDQTKNS